MIMDRDQKSELKEPITPELSDQTPEQEQERQEKLKQFYAQYFKDIPFGSLTEHVKQLLDGILFLIESLKTEINLKRSGVLEKKSLMQEKLASLKTSSKINVNDAEFDKFHKSIDEYVRLLDSMMQEVERDLAFYQSYLSPNPPAHISVERSAPDAFDAILGERIKMVRKNVKNAKRDLAVSYSRYCYGFEAQMRQIVYVESLLALQKPTSSGS